MSKPVYGIKTAEGWKRTDDGRIRRFDGEEGEAAAWAEVRSMGDPHASVERLRGFAVMDRVLVSEIARRGGRAAHEAGTAHEFSPEEGRTAGRKGGLASHAKRRAAGLE